MANVLYHEVSPSNDNSAGFKEFNTIDWELLVEGRKLLKNSITVEADIKVESTSGTDVVVASVIGVDHRIGFHSCFESWSTEAKGQMLENLNDYPRYVSMVTAATMDENDVCDAKAQAEGRQVTEAAGRYVIQGQRVNNKNASTTAHVNSANFSIEPKICFNSVVGDDYSFSKNGAIRISCNVARNNSALFGGGSATAQFTLTNVKLSFMSIPDDGSQSAMMMNSVVSVKSAVNSQAANISARVPAAASNGVVISFIEQSNENSTTANSYALEKFPNLDEVQYLFSDSTNKYVSYVIDDKGEMVQRGLSALSDSGENQVSAVKFASNEGHIIGLSFEEYLDLRTQKFSVQLKTSSPDISAKPRLVYLYFLNLLQL